MVKLKSDFNFLHRLRRFSQIFNFLYESMKSVVNISLRPGEILTTQRIVRYP